MNKRCRNSVDMWKRLQYMLKTWIESHYLELTISEEENKKARIKSIQKAISKWKNKYSGMKCRAVVVEPKQSYDRFFVRLLDLHERRDIELTAAEIIKHRETLKRAITGEHFSQIQFRSIH